MQDLMRKHKRAILVFMLLFMIVPFVFFFGIPSSAYVKNKQQQFSEKAMIGKVGGVPLYAQEFRGYLDQLAERQGRGGERPNYQELDKSGEAEKVLKQMVDSALITLAEKKRKFDVANSLAAEQMKKWRIFQDDNGKFNPESWNEWVKQSKNQDWKALYADQKERISRRVYMDMLMASAGRVLDKDIQKKVEDNYTKIQIKYAKIDPKVEPTEEDIQKQYDDNKETYKTPDTRVVEYVSLSLDPPMPQKALDLVKQAREGADFAKLADENSDLKQQNGGDMGWQSMRDNEPEFRKPLFDLKAGEISDPILGFNSYYIFKVEEERTNEENQKREVHARQIMIKSELPKEEHEKLNDKAKAISDKAKEMKDFPAVAKEYSLEIKRTGPFTKESEEIENFPKNDVRQFRMAFEEQMDDNPYKVVAARSNIYVAHMMGLTPGIIPALADIKDKVREDTIEALKQKDEYKNKVKDYAKKIEEKATSLAQINELFPELAVEIKESSEFTAKDYLFKEQMYVPPTDIFSEVGHGEPGTFGGPLTDYQGNTFFVELLKRTPPAEEDKAKWDEDRKKLRDTETRQAENAILEDYLADMRERTLPQVSFTTNQAMIDEILGRNQPNEAEGEGTGEGEPAKEGEAASSAPAPEK
ncbi:MAG TPA: peptidyl-prolyl cis-trans isomerase [Candidatus Hydrogenedentes bacterium]|nr:peptidyl-prolyl cis-trans isomerase [Candidatus Hydrogenedentota bacterium]